jgi:hypothetical protein
VAGCDSGTWNGENLSTGCFVHYSYRKERTSAVKEGYLPPWQGHGGCVEMGQKTGLESTAVYEEETSVGDISFSLN